MYSIYSSSKSLQFAYDTSQMTNKMMVGLPGLATDVQSVSQLLHFKLNMYRLREESSHFQINQ